MYIQQKICHFIKKKLLFAKSHELNQTSTARHFLERIRNTIQYIIPYFNCLIEHHYQLYYYTFSMT